MYWKLSWIVFYRKDGMKMDRSKKKKAAIVIGDERMYDPVDMWDCDVYYYPENVTEWELAEEISSLVEFYDELVYPIYWPPHLRKEKVIAWING
jgi:hypothetical protein